MDALDDDQKLTVFQLQELTNGSDDDAAISVLASVDWDVHHFVIDDSLVGGPRHRVTCPHHAPSGFLALLVRPLLALLAAPLHVLSGLVRLLFGVLRLPRWLRELEEETGAVSVGRAQVPRGLVVDVACRRGGAGALGLEDGRKYLPDFVVCGYEEMLRTCQREAKIGCVVLVSAEHDDVAEFKRSTLTDPAFVRILHENEIIVWGGDVRDQDAWSASEKLQATTYPFVAFVALQPRRSPLASPSQSTSAPPTLTVLSRHQGPATPAQSGPTAAATLTAHLRDRLLPRRARTQDRDLRAEQDRAFHAAAARDKARIERKMQEEREARTLVWEREERERREARDRERAEELRRRRAGERMGWRRWTRRVIGGLRIAIRLPSGARVVHAFAPGATLTALYAAVDALLVPAEFAAADDPLCPPEAKLEAHVLADGGDTGVDAYWGFKVASAYPRVEIPWRTGARLGEVEVLKGGGQVVVELVKEQDGRRRSIEREDQNGSEEDEDDGYHTEESE
ncbi:hypothetical protein BJ912DRAFT_1021722 [Pholiota molesta]|nr:hypothetical protein BJ912DRAFT_1021722 [Pholiota molesta]